MDGATLGVLFIAAYLVVSPDPVSLTVTRGSAGAGKAVGRRMKARSTARGGSARRRGTTFREAVRQAWADARYAAAVARTRRAADRDTFSQMKRAVRAGYAAVGTAYQTSGRLTDRARAGMRAGMDRWTRLTPGNARHAVALPSGRHSGSTRSTTSPPNNASAAAPADGQPPASDAGEPTTHKTNNNTSSKTSPKEGENTMDVTELESLEAVRAEARQAVQMSESLTEVVAAVKEWATGLADRWSGTEWGTADLDRAVAGVGEAAGTLVGGEALSEALVAVEDAVKRAEALGEVATEIGAHGDVDAFRSA
jgi:hypothetical protein